MMCLCFVGKLQCCDGLSGDTHIVLLLYVGFYCPHTAKIQNWCTNFTHHTWQLNIREKMWGLNPRVHRELNREKNELVSVRRSLWRDAFGHLTAHFTTFFRMRSMLATPTFRRQPTSSQRFHARTLLENETSRIGLDYSL